MTIKQLIAVLADFNENDVAHVYLVTDHGEDGEWLPVECVWQIESGKVAVDWE